MSRDRWIQLIAVLGLIASTVWIARHTYWDELSITTPPKGEAARNPYYAVMQLAGHLGIRASMIGSLHALPPDAIVLVNSLHDDLRHGSVESLQAWVQSGGRLIIRSDTLETSEPLQVWSGIAPVPPDAVPARPARSADDDCKPMVVSLNGVPSGRSLALCNLLPTGLTSGRVPSWSLSNSDGIQVLRVAIGRGELTVVGPGMLANWNLPKGDHAQIFVAAAGLRHGDRLEILGRTRAEPLPVLLWRLAAPGIFPASGRRYRWCRPSGARSRNRSAPMRALLGARKSSGRCAPPCGEPWTRRRRGGSSDTIEWGRASARRRWRRAPVSMPGRSAQPCSPIPQAVSTNIVRRSCCWMRAAAS
jgi:hypothetical protein